MYEKEKYHEKGRMAFLFLLYKKNSKNVLYIRIKYIKCLLGGFFQNIFKRNKYEDML